MNALGRMSLATVLLGFWLRFRGLDGRLLGVPRGCQALGVLPRWVVHRTGRDRQRALQFELFQRWPRPMTRSRADPLAFRERGAVFVPSQKFSSGSRSSNSRGVDRIVPAAERIPSLDSSCRWPRRVPDCPVFTVQPCPVSQTRAGTDGLAQERWASALQSAGSIHRPRETCAGPISGGRAIPSPRRRLRA